MNEKDSIKHINANLKKIAMAEREACARTVEDADPLADRAQIARAIRDRPTDIFD